MPAPRSDLLDDVAADQLVAGDHRPGVREPLVTVDDPAVVHAEVGILGDRQLAASATTVGKVGGATTSG